MSSIMARMPSAREIWAKFGLDVGTFLIIIKGVLPAVICVAMYESTVVMKQYTTLGYLNSIIAALSFCFIPRARFIQLSILNALGTCIGAAFSLLIMYCATQARLHTTPPDQMNALMQQLAKAASDPTAGSILDLPYNSSASAVCGIWLFFGTWISTAVRVRRPHLIFPVVMFNIIVNVSATYGTVIPTMDLAKAFAKEVLLSILTGLGISFGVGLFFIPITSRMSAGKKIVAYVGLLKQIVHGEQERLNALESRRADRNKVPAASSPSDNTISAAPPALQHLPGMHRALEAEIQAVAREIEFNRFRAEDYDEIFNALGAVGLQVRGLNTIAEALEHSGKSQPQSTRQSFDAHIETEKADRPSVTIFRNASALLSEITVLALESLDHFLLVLDLAPSSLKKAARRDAAGDEARESCSLPGEASFSEYLKQQRQSLHARALENVGQLQLRLKSQSMEPDTKNATRIDELYLLLHMQAIIGSTGKSLMHLVTAADRIRADDKAFKNALRYPSWDTLKKWAHQIYSAQTSDIWQMDHDAKAAFGDLYHGLRDPEREPDHAPGALLQPMTSRFRSFYRFFGSEPSQIGFRAACATMSIAIVAFLASSQIFFIKQRLIWATITVAVAFTTSSGSATRGLIWRIVGTVVAMVFSFINYYIVDGKTAGMIVFLFVFLCIDMYVIVKFPRYLIAGLLGLVTQVLIIGYELQTRKIGDQAAESTGQPVYPIYELAPYRLLTVMGGCFSAFIWTVFPSVTTDAYRIRIKIGNSFDLLAQYLTLSKVIWDMDLAAFAGCDSSSKDSWHREKLVSMRVDIFSRMLVLIQEVRLHLNDSLWDTWINGHFPKQKYSEMASRIENITSHIGLISRTADSVADLLETDASNEANQEWRKDVVDMLLSRQSGSIVCILSMLAGCLRDCSPLPPILLPKLDETSAEVEKVPAVDQITYPALLIFAASRVFTQLWIKELEMLVNDVKDLTGEFRFSILDSSAIYQARR